jgi:hypothetical protein
MGVGHVLLYLFSSCATPSPEEGKRKLDISSQIMKPADLNHSYQSGIAVKDKSDIDAEFGTEKSHSEISGNENIDKIVLMDGNSSNDVDDKSRDSNIPSEALIEKNKTPSLKVKSELSEKFSTPFNENGVEAKILTRGRDDTLEESNQTVPDSSSNPNLSGVELPSAMTGSLEPDELMNERNEDDLPVRGGEMLESFFETPAPDTGKNSAGESKTAELSTEIVERAVQVESNQSRPESDRLIFTESESGKIGSDQEVLNLEKKKENVLPRVQSGNLVGFAPPFELEDTEEKKGRNYKNLTLRSKGLDVRESTGGNRDRRVGLTKRNEEQISSTGLNTFRVGFKDLNQDERKKDEKVFKTEDLQEKRKGIEGFGKIRSFLNRKNITENTSIQDVNTDFYRAKSYLYPSKKSFNNEVPGELDQSGINRYQKSLYWIKHRGRN